MIFNELEINGVYSIELNPLEDKRGFFMRTYDIKYFESLGLNTNWVHENHSESAKAGTIRGFHFQFPPHSETKLIRVVRGSVKDVFLDIRKSSPTFGKWGSVILSSKNKNCLYLPKGIAHGMCTLEDYTNMVYKVDNVYEPDMEGQINPLDSFLDIDWPEFQTYTISDKDKNAIDYKSFIEHHGGIEL